jgi:hypothetical protein
MSDYAPPASIQEEVLIFLLSAPSPEQIIAFHASETAQQRLRYLLDANRQGTLSPEEHAELEEASQMNHFITLLKAKAHQTLQST